MVTGDSVVAVDAMFTGDQRQVVTGDSVIRGLDRLGLNGRTGRWRLCLLELLSEPKIENH